MPNFILALPIAALGFGLYELERKVLRRRRTRGACARAIEAQLGLSVLGVLGRGREGVVFETRSSPSARSAAVKVLYAYSGAEGDRALARLAQISGRLESVAAARPARWPRVRRMGALKLGRDRSVPYIEMEKLSGKTLAQSYPGALPLARRAAQAVELLDCLEALARAEVHFIHVDADNILLDRAGCLNLIDLDGFELGALRDSARWRMHRRLARALLALLEPEGPGAPRPADHAFSDYLRRLRLLRATPRGARPAPETGIESLADFAAPLAALAAPTVCAAGLELE